MLAVLVSSSLVQPLFGLLSDRRGAIWLLPAGVAVGGLGTGLAAVAPRYELVLLLVFIAGIGIAAFHPEGAKFAAYASGHKRASGMSYFNIGGNTGYALGPIIVTPLVLWLGLTGGLLAMLPVLVAAAVLLRALHGLEELAPETEARERSSAVDDVRAMTILGVVIALRSVAWFGLLTFVPLWVVENGGTNVSRPNQATLRSPMTTPRIVMARTSSTAPTARAPPPPARAPRAAEAPAGARPPRRGPAASRGGRREAEPEHERRDDDRPERVARVAADVEVRHSARALAPARVRRELRALGVVGGDPDAREEDEQQHELVARRHRGEPVPRPPRAMPAGRSHIAPLRSERSPKSGWTREDETSTASISTAVAV